jgi:hypothetical protein
MMVAWRLLYEVAKTHSPIIHAGEGDVSVMMIGRCRRRRLHVIIKQMVLRVCERAEIESLDRARARRKSQKGAKLNLRRFTQFSHGWLGARSLTVAPLSRAQKTESERESPVEPCLLSRETSYLIKFLRFLEFVEEAHVENACQFHDDKSNYVEYEAVPIAE